MHTRVKNDLPVASEARKETGLPSHEEIAARAYDLFEQSGRTDGHNLDDWLHAEEELFQKRHQRSGS